jgi:hypothetical protein
MPKSINQDIVAGSSVYHIQTEYYKSSGKIVTNIFKDGRSVKRLEKEISTLNDEEIDKEIEKFHTFVISKLTGKAKEKEYEREKTGISLPEDIYDRLLVEISPYYGIASSLVLDEGLAFSSSVNELISFLTEDLPDEQSKELAGKLSFLLESVIRSRGKEEEEEERAPFAVTPELEEKVLKVLSEYFGIMASAVWEDSLEQWRASGGTTYEELLEAIVSHGDSEEEREELRTRLSFL